MPAVPSYDRELRSKTVAELLVLEADKNARRDFMRKNDVVDVFVKKEAADKREVAQIARQNLEKETTLRQLQAQIEQLYVQYKEKQEEIDDLERRQRALASQHAPEELCRQLDDMAFEVEEATESIAREFGDGRMEAATFMQQFVDERRRMHMLKAKAALLKAQ